MVSIFGMGKAQGKIQTPGKKDITKEDINKLLSTVRDGSASAQDSAKNKLQGIANKPISSVSRETMVKSLIEALKDENPNVRSVAAETLGVLVISKTGVSSKLMAMMVDPLIKTSEDPFDDVRDSAVYALGCILVSGCSSTDFPKIVKQLGSIVLNEKDRVVQDRAGSGLQEFINSSNNIPDLRSMRDIINTIKNDAYSSGKSYPGIVALDSLLGILDKKII